MTSSSHTMPHKQPSGWLERSNRPLFFWKSLIFRSFDFSRSKMVVAEFQSNLNACFSLSTSYVDIDL